MNDVNMSKAVEWALHT